MPCVVDLRDEREDLLHQDRREAQGRLVQQQQPGSGHERPPDGQHLLLAAGQRATLLVQALAEPREQHEGLLHVLGAFARPCG